MAGAVHSHRGAVKGGGGRRCPLTACHLEMQGLEALKPPLLRPATQHSACLGVVALPADKVVGAGHPLSLLLHSTRAGHLVRLCRLRLIET